MPNTVPNKSGRAGKGRQVQTSTPLLSATDIGKYLRVPTESIIAKGINPRQTFDETDLEELTASVAEKGILEPLLVRPSLLKGKGLYQLVAGERRWRAAKRAKLQTVPVILHNWTDREALEVAVIENEQRKDVPVLEKAIGYRKLMEQYDYSAAQLAERIKKSEAQIHATVKLLDVPDFVKPLINSGEVSKSHAEIIARVPNEEGRAKLARDIIYGYGSSSTVNVVSVKEAKRLSDNYTRELSKAVFDTTVDNLIPGVIACTKCPYKSGNNRLEYGSGRADICNNVSCYSLKTEAGRALKLDSLKESKGAIALSKEDIKKYLPYGYLSGNTPYVELGSQCYQDKKYRSYRQLVGKELGKSVRLFVAVKERDDSIIELALRSEVNEVLKRVHNIDLNGRAGSGKENAERRMRSQARALVVVKVLGLVADSFRKQSTGGFSAKFDKQLRLATLMMIHNVSNDGLRDVSKRRGIIPKGQYPRFADELEKAAASLRGAELFGLLMEVGVATSLFNWKGPYSSSVSKRTQEVLKAAGVDLTALENAELKDIKQKRKEREERAKANKAKKAKKTSGKNVQTAEA